MKSLSVVLVAAACLAASAAYARDAAVESVIQHMTESFEKGDIAAVKAAHVAAPRIVDNVAPFAWSGPGAFDRWLADLGKADAAAGKTGAKVTFAPVVDEVVHGDRAFVVTRSVYAYQQKGRAMKESGYTSFVLVKVGSDWKIESWSWASPAAVPGK